MKKILQKPITWGSYISVNIIANIIACCIGFGVLLAVGSYKPKEKEVSNKRKFDDYFKMWEGEA